MVSGIRLGGRIPPRVLPLSRTTAASGDRHPPTRPEGATESVGALSGPFALLTGVAGTAGGLGKGPALVAVLVRLVSRLRASLVVITRRLLLSAGSFPTCPPNGWQSWLWCCHALAASGCGEDAGPRWRLCEPC